MDVWYDISEDSLDAKKVKPAITRPNVILSFPKYTPTSTSSMLCNPPAKCCKFCNFLELSNCLRDNLTCISQSLHLLYLLLYIAFVVNKIDANRRLYLPLEIGSMDDTGANIVVKKAKGLRIGSKEV